MWRIRPFLNEHSMLLIIHAYILSQLDYCNSILAICPAYRVRRLRRALNACIRVLKRLSRMPHISPILKDLGLLPVSLRIDFKICCFVHKCKYGTSPAYLRDLVRYAHSATATTSLRSQEGPLIHLPLEPRSRGRGAFSVRGPQLWNSLPLKCRLEPSYPIFKRLLKDELLRTFCT